MYTPRWASICLFIGIFISFNHCASIRASFPASSSGSSNQQVRGGDAQLRDNVVQLALNQLGSRYKYAGRTPRSGFDCSGFTYFVFGEFDISVTPVSRSQETEGRRIDLDNVRAGDLVFFRRSRTGPVFHVALVVRNDRDGLVVVHSTSSRGVVVDNIDQSSYWRPKLSSARDIISTR